MLLYFTIISSSSSFATEFKHPNRVWTIFDRFSVLSMSFSETFFFSLILSSLKWLTLVLSVLFKFPIVALTSWTKNSSDLFFNAMLWYLVLFSPTLIFLHHIGFHYIIFHWRQFFLAIFSTWIFIIWTK